MHYQKYAGIYIYFKRNVYNYWKDCYNTKIDVIYYKSLEEYFWHHTEFHIRRDIGYNIHDKKCCYVVARDYGHGWRNRRYVKHEYFCGKINCREHGIAGTDMYVVYDENGKQYTPDVLVGLRRAWKSKEFRNRYRRNTNGRKKAAWGGFRRFKTFQERKWADAWKDEEFAPHVRRARAKPNLPDPWDDHYSCGSKSWKHQSKRKYQWKEKNVKL